MTDVPADTSPSISSRLLDSIAGRMNGPASSGIERLLAVRPQWERVAAAAEVVGLGARELLHAGPPLQDPRRPPAVVVSSAAVACVHEGWFADLGAAEEAIRAGDVTLGSAQERGCVLPLAFVASASTPLCVVGDASGSIAARCAPLSTLRGADSRMGGRDAALPQRLARRDHGHAPAFGRLLAEHGPLALSPLAAAGLAAGDDLHSRTTVANAGVAAWLRGHGAASLADDVEASPLFFLTLWMAACSLMLGALEGTPGSTCVARAGGNGERFGIALAGTPSRWSSTVAEPPRGHRSAAAAGETELCGAIGDSAVVDMVGFGGQRLALAPEPRLALAGFVPADLDGRAERLLLAPHPVFAGWPVGLDARRVQALAQPPLVCLSMIAADGRTGFVGRGVYQPPLALFDAALEHAAQPS